VNDIVGGLSGLGILDLFRHGVIEVSVVVVLDVVDRVVDKTSSIYACDDTRLILVTLTKENKSQSMELTCTSLRFLKIPASGSLRFP
jgi:hypothetical protein